MKKARYEYLEHTADAMFRAYGDTLEEAFAAAAQALAGLMWNPDEVRPRVTRGVKVTGRDRPQLLVAFLEEVLFLLETEGFMLREAVDVTLSSRGVERRGDDLGFVLTATLRGGPLSAGTATHGEVKAVTYNQIEVDPGGPGRPAVVQVVVDM